MFLGLGYYILSLPPASCPLSAFSNAGEPDKVGMRQLASVFGGVSARKPQRQSVASRTSMMSTEMH